MKGTNQFLLRTIIYATALAMLVACDKKRPEGVLTQAQMVEVMGHIYITEEKVNQLGVPRDSAKKIFFAMSQKVFEDAGVRDSVFKKSFDYYMERPKEMELIYTALVDTLQLREQRAPVTDGHP